MLKVEKIPREIKVLYITKYLKRKNGNLINTKDVSNWSNERIDSLCSKFKDHMYLAMRLK